MSSASTTVTLPLPNSSSFSSNSQSFSASSSSADDHSPSLRPSVPPAFIHSSYQPAMIRADWISKQLHSKTKEFTISKKITVFCGTWNVNAKKPQEELHSWLYPDGIESDMYAIGFQEIVDLNAANLVVDHNAAKPWEDRIERTLKQQYLQVGSKHLVGLSLCVYVRRMYFPYISEINFDTCGVGIMGVGGNKGAVAMRFRMYDSTFCFVNSHLAAHQHNCAGRNADFHNISQRVRFTIEKSAAGGSSGNNSGNNNSSSSTSNSNNNNNSNNSNSGNNSNNNATNNATLNLSKSAMLSIYDHDHLFWVGDLNYRLNMSDLALVYQRIDLQDWPFLLSNDQLIAEKTAGNAFSRFREGLIDFPPTYKFQPGTHEYERREGKKKRTPAYCDRIQWISDDVIRQILYKRAELTVSDHKPVCAVFETAVKEINEDKRKEVIAALSRQLDAWENENVPKVAMNPSSIRFTNLLFDTPQTLKLTIENIGAVVVQWHFAPKLQDDNFCRAWLQVSPEFGIIPPKESMEIEIRAHVTPKLAHGILIGQDNVDDILILRLENGRDYFVTVVGEYQRSAFGATIEYLINNTVPIRFSSIDKKKDLNVAEGNQRVLPVPKELWRIIDWLYRHALDHEHLFARSGVRAEVDRIRDALDTGADLENLPNGPNGSSAMNNFSPHSMYETLLLFIKCFAEPVYPDWLVDQYTGEQTYAGGLALGGSSAALTAYCKQALQQLSPAHYNVFIYLISFLREALKHSESNRVNVQTLIYAFAPAIFSNHPEMQTEMKASQTKNQADKSIATKPKTYAILKHFLTSEDFIS